MYSSTAIIFLIVAVLIPAYFIFYEKPTCFDGKLNGKELDVDCGGACEKLCPSSFMGAQVSWTRFEKVAPKLYNLAAYIVNPNTDAEAKNVPYVMQVFDTTGMVISELKGNITLPPHRNTLAFKPAIDVGERIPSKVAFFLGTPDWNKKSDPLASVSVKDQEYSEDENGSSLIVNIFNSALEPIGPITAYVVLYDKENNAVGFSKTIIDEIPPKGTSVAPFTWPVNREGNVLTRKVLLVKE